MGNIAEAETVRKAETMLVEEVERAWNRQTFNTARSYAVQVATQNLIDAIELEVLHNQRRGV